MLPTLDDIHRVLATIPDPEMPISIVDLGIVEDVAISPLTPGEGSGVREYERAEERRSESGTNPQLEEPSPQPSPGGRGSGQSSACAVRITILPTFIGCPALPMIEDDIRATLSALEGVDRVDVRFVNDPPWTVDRITDVGREQLKAHGVTVPESGDRLIRNAPTPSGVELRTSAIPCPFCGSTETRLDSPFGPTRCRMIYYCERCRNGFEHLKRL
jgi:ring-1,2-phenylacetyl-CoA epoxidase subunit PaaD